LLLNNLYIIALGISVWEDDGTSGTN